MHVELNSTYARISPTRAHIRLTLILLPGVNNSTKEISHQHAGISLHYYSPGWNHRFYGISLTLRGLQKSSLTPISGSISRRNSKVIQKQCMQVWWALPALWLLHPKDTYQAPWFESERHFIPSGGLCHLYGYKCSWLLMSGTVCDMEGLAQALHSPLYGQQFNTQVDLLKKQHKKHLFLGFYYHFPLRNELTIACYREEQCQQIYFPAVQSDKFMDWSL